MTNGTLSTRCINGPGVQVGRRKGKQMKLPAFWLWFIGTVIAQFKMYLESGPTCMQFPY